MSMTHAQRTTMNDKQEKIRAAAKERKRNQRARDRNNGIVEKSFRGTREEIDRLTEAFKKIRGELNNE